MENLYNKEFKLYLEYALEQYLINNKGYSEAEAKTKVMQDFNAVYYDAKQDGYL